MRKEKMLAHEVPHGNFSFLISPFSFNHPMFSPLLTWYQQNGRDLPWRHTQDPYKIWLSEIILQQTRVEQGLAYYLRFTEAFPTVNALAAANEDEVLRLWQGLGYYSRARNLHEAARQIVRLGAFPTSYTEIRKLKGIGDYTAAAIASFAYGLPHAVVDGNVYRVLSRVFAISTPIDSSEGKHQFARLAQELLPPKHAALHNQAIMDLGALICTPRSPQCAACPLNNICIAHTEHSPEDFPVKTKHTQVRTRFFTYIIATDGTNILLHRRSKGDIWQGLYEPILLETEQPLHVSDFFNHPLLKSLPSTDITLTPLVADMSHKLSHQNLRTWAYLLRTSAPLTSETIPTYASIPIIDLNNYALPRLITRILEQTEALSSL